MFTVINASWNIFTIQTLAPRGEEDAYIDTRTNPAQQIVQYLISVSSNFEFKNKSVQNKIEICSFTDQFSWLPGNILTTTVAEPAKQYYSKLY